MKKIEHIGIAVANAESSIKLFNALFNKEPYKIEKVASEGVNTYFYEMGETKIELLEATKPDSPIAKFISKQKEGIHHIAFHVDNIHDGSFTSILYFNTCNGWTEFMEGPKVRTIENRLVTFPTCYYHSGVTCTDQESRVVINFNYF